MSSSRRFLSKSASFHQLSHRRYDKQVWLAQDWQWNFKHQGFGFGFVLGSHQKCLSFEVFSGDNSQNLVLSAKLQLYHPKPKYKKLHPSIRLHAYAILVFQPAFFSLCNCLTVYTHVCACTYPSWGEGHNLAEDWLQLASCHAATGLWQLWLVFCTYLGSDGTRWG